MKKILLSIGILGFAAILGTNTANAINYYTNPTPNGGNMNFYPLMQHQMEKEETLDFINNPENYKQKRETKEDKLDYQEGKSGINPYLKPTSINLGGKKLNPLQASPSPMEFTKDENGQIKIQGIK